MTTKSLIAAINLVLFSFNLSFGQQASYSHLSLQEKAAPAQSYINKILRYQSMQSKQAAKTTQIEERLVATSAYNFSDSITTNIGLTDSAHFTYSGARSSFFDYNNMAYDNSYQVNGLTLFGVGATVGFPDHNNIPCALSDTTLIWTTIEFVYLLLDTRYSIYDADDNIIDYADLPMQDSSSTYQDSRFLNTYDGNGNIATSLALTWNMGVWDTSEKRFFSYDINNVLIEDSTDVYAAGMLFPKEKWIHTYSSGNLTNADLYIFDGTNWSISESYILDYYTDNSLKSSTVSIAISGVQQTVFRDTFGYQSGTPYTVYNKVYTYQDGLPLAYDISTKHISAIGLPDTTYNLYSTITDTPIAQSKIVYEYDGYDEPVKAISYNYELATQTYQIAPAAIQHYYYETYNKPEGVTQTMIGKELVVFPNPVKDELYIKYHCPATGTIISVKLNNAAGRLVRSESIPWYNETEKVSLHGLPPGSYFLSIKDSHGADVGSQVIEKE